MQFFSDYGLFLLETLTWVGAILLLVAGIVALLSKEKQAKRDEITVKNLNDAYFERQKNLQKTLLDKKAFRKWYKQHKDQEKSCKNKKNCPRLFLLRFNGDIRARAVDQLRQEITAILSIAKPKDEILLLLESGGGTVNGYGLGAAELARIKQNNINLTVAVDKVAASGGYLMACVADKLIAAPFALIGSIGVIAQIPNFHRWLKEHNVDFEQITAGEFKRTLTLFGENTDKARAKMQEDISAIHHQFKQFVAKHRQQLDLAQAATGEYWTAMQALELKLVDELCTSESYLQQKLVDYIGFEIGMKQKIPMAQKMIQSMSSRFKKFFSLISDPYNLVR